MSFEILPMFLLFFSWLFLFTGLINYLSHLPPPPDNHRPTWRTNSSTTRQPHSLTSHPFQQPTTTPPPSTTLGAHHNHVQQIASDSVHASRGSLQTAPRHEHTCKSFLKPSTAFTQSSRTRTTQIYAFWMPHGVTRWVNSFL